MSASWSLRVRAHVFERDERQDEQHSGMGVACTPQVLPQRIRFVARIRHEHRQERDATAHDSGDHDEQDAGNTL